MVLKLGNLEFPIAEATLSAQVPDPHWSARYNPEGNRRLFWSLSIRGKRRRIDGETWEPCAYHESLRFPIRRWRDVAGQVVTWDSPFNERDGEPNGGFYVFEHDEIPRATLRLSSNSGVRFRVSWEGACHVNWDEKYGRDVPFSLEADAAFTGVTVLGSGADNDHSIRERLLLYLDLDDLMQQPIKIGPHKYEDGALIARSTFEPKRS